MRFHAAALVVAIVLFVLAGLPDTETHHSVRLIGLGLAVLTLAFLL